MEYNQKALEILEAMIKDPLRTLSRLNPEYRAKGGLQPHC